MTEKIDQQSADFLNRQLHDAAIIRSCWNCEHMNKLTGLCDRYDSHPPLEVLVFSCGDGWVMDPPF